MKKTLTAILSVVMLFAMVTVFAGCSNLADQFVGTWKAEVDLADMVNAELAATDETTAEYFSIDSFTVTMVMTFTEEGTFTAGLDEDSVKTSFDAMMEDLKEGVVKMLEDQIKASGLQMTVDEMLAFSGMTLDSMMEQIKTGFEEEGLVAQIVEEAAMEGNFAVEEGKLFLSAGPEYAVDKAVYETYTMDGTTLTLTGHVGSDEDEGLGLYPMTFNKAA